MTTKGCWCSGPQISHGPWTQPSGDGKCYPSVHSFHRFQWCRFCVDCAPSMTWLDLRRGSTSLCLRSMPVASCSNSIWAQLPPASPNQTLLLSARRRMDTRAPIFLLLSETLSCSPYERSSQQHTSNGYVFYHSLPFMCQSLLLFICYIF